MAVIKEYMQGACKIIIHDDFIRPDKEEVQRIVNNVSKIIVNDLRSREIHKRQEETKI